MAQNGDGDVTHRLILARVGWCDKYDGDVNDSPRNGGENNKDNRGWEHRNFVKVRGELFYGYARPARGGKASLNRVSDRPPLDPGTEDERIEDVCVAMIAKSDSLGQVLVGWHRHATFFAREQHRRRWFLWQAPAKRGVLLQVDARTLRVPSGRGATGESNLTYARDKFGNLLQGRRFIDEIREVILTYDPTGNASPLQNLDAIVRGQGFQYDALYRSEIEARAMTVARRALKKMYNTVVDCSKIESFDFQCRNGNGRPRLIEVKGTTTAGNAVLVSSNEYDLARRERVDLYIVSDVQLRFDGDEATAHGGFLTIHENWGKKGFNVNPRGYAVTLPK